MLSTRLLTDYLFHIIITSLTATSLGVLFLFFSFSFFFFFALISVDATTHHTNQPSSYKYKGKILHNLSYDNTNNNNPNSNNNNPNPNNPNNDDDTPNEDDLAKRVVYGADNRSDIYSFIAGFGKSPSSSDQSFLNNLQLIANATAGMISK